ncbi:MAG: recombination regulator RecX [Burkholderiales bacterium]
MAHRGKEPSPAQRALRLLARRELSRLELARKLAPHVPDALELQALLDDCAARGWLSEARAAEAIVHAKCGRFGPAHIRKTLTDKGIPPELIAPAVKQVRRRELETARAVWVRRFHLPAATASERAKQVRFLQSRGFSLEVAMRVVHASARGDLDGD